MTYQDFLTRLFSAFPLLTSVNSRPTSPATDEYNCIAWAGEDADRWWWPDVQGQAYWPPGAPRNLTLEAFIQAYNLLGYTVPCDSSIEPSKQKVAIYTLNGTPTHAARQLLDGWWASKLGKDIDIEHEFHALDGPVYGAVTVILARVSNRP
jgi:hypothetical protein